MANDVDAKPYVSGSKWRVGAGDASAYLLLNRDWRRRSLGYETAEERWNARVVPAIDRDLLRNQVLELAERIRQRIRDVLLAGTRVGGLPLFRGRRVDDLHQPAERRINEWRGTRVPSETEFFLQSCDRSF